MRKSWMVNHTFTTASSCTPIHGGGDGGPLGPSSPLSPKSQRRAVVIGGFARDTAPVAVAAPLRVLFQSPYITQHPTRAFISIGFAMWDKFR